MRSDICRYLQYHPIRMSQLSLHEHVLRFKPRTLPSCTLLGHFASSECLVFDGAQFLFASYITRICQLHIKRHLTFSKRFLSFKVYAENPTWLKNASKDLLFSHNMLKNSSLNDTQCKKNVADAICKASIPACSKDQSKVVFLLSKQKCREIIGW